MGRARLVARTRPPAAAMRCRIRRAMLLMALKPFDNSVFGVPMGWFTDPYQTASIDNGWASRRLRCC
jgi:hypothetical protein